jgi:replication factor A1
MSESKKVEELNPGSRSVDVLVKVVELYPVREVTTKDGSSHRVAEALVGDETGSVILSLWDEAASGAQAGKIIQVRNGYISLYKGNMRLNIGKYGTMEDTAEAVGEVNTENNISNRSYDQQIPKFRPLYTNSDRGRYGRGRR